MRVKDLLLLLVVIPAVVLLPCCRTPGVAEREAKGSGGPVRAVRYRFRAFESMLEFTHGGGTWIEELYFPEQGVVSNVSGSYREGGEEEKPTMHAWHGEIRNRYLRDAGSLEAGDMEAPTEDVLVPEELARQIFALADLTDRLRSESDRLGENAVASGNLHWNVGPPEERK